MIRRAEGQLEDDDDLMFFCWNCVFLSISIYCMFKYTVELCYNVLSVS